MGNWKLNEAKSKFAPGVPKNHTVVYETAGDNVKITVDGTDKDGKSTHNEWTGKFDGKDYSVTGDPTSDIRSYQKVGDRVLKMTIKKDGKVIITGRIIVSADGKTPHSHYGGGRCGRQGLQKQIGIRQAVVGQTLATLTASICFCCAFVASCCSTLDFTPRRRRQMSNALGYWRPNQTMKSTASLRNNSSVFATTPCRGLSLSR
jgi:hypothetical protein